MPSSNTTHYNKIKTKYKRGHFEKNNKWEVRSELRNIVYLVYIVGHTTNKENNITNIRDITLDAHYFPTHNI